MNGVLLGIGNTETPQIIEDLFMMGLVAITPPTGDLGLPTFIHTRANILERRKLLIEMLKAEYE